MKNIFDSIEYLMRLNLDVKILDSLDNSLLNVFWYQEILKEVLKLKEKPKRIVDVGSNMNQYGYLFANEGIEYIGIDMISKKDRIPIETPMIKYVNSDYNKVVDLYKEDVIISCLCVGYAVPVEKVKAKLIIINDLDIKGRPVAKVVKR